MTVGRGGAREEDLIAGSSENRPGLMRVQERESVAKVCECIRGIYPETRFSERELRELVEESFVAADENYDIQEAVEWGKDFSWPEGIVKRDLSKLKKSNYNLSSMVE